MSEEETMSRRVRRERENAAKENPRSPEKKPSSRGGRKVFGIVSGLGLAVIATIVALVASAGIAADGSSRHSILPQGLNLGLGSPNDDRKIEVPVANINAGASAEVCPGPARLLQGTGQGADPQFGPNSQSAKTSVSALISSDQRAALPDSKLTPISSDPEAPALTEVSKASPPAEQPKVGEPAVQPVYSRLDNFSFDRTAVLRTEPVEGKRTPVAAVQTYSATDGDLRGIAALSCQPSTNETMLLGSSSRVGRSSVLLLSNVSSSPAQVELDLYGDSGPIRATGASSLLVPSGTVRAVVLAGLAQDQNSFAVRVRSSGGPVAAVIQEAAIRGLTSGGVDFITSTAIPSQQQVIAGVEAMDPGLARDIAAQGDYQDAVTALKVLVPGAEDAIIQVKVYGQSGQASLPEGGVFTAKGGSVSEFPLTGLPAGSYTVEVQSDNPVSAVVRSVRGTKPGEPVDFSISPASQKLADQHLVPFASGAESRLVFGSPSGQSTLAITPISPEGKSLPSKELSILPNTTVVVKPQELVGGPVAGFLVSTAGAPVYGAQVLTQTDGVGLSVAGIPANPTSTQSLRVGMGY